MKKTLAIFSLGMLLSNGAQAAVSDYTLFNTPAAKRTKVVNATQGPIWVDWTAVSKPMQAVRGMLGLFSSDDYMPIAPGKYEIMNHTGDKLLVNGIACKGGKPETVPVEYITKWTNEYQRVDIREDSPGVFSVHESIKGSIEPGKPGSASTAGATTVGKK